MKERFRFVTQFFGPKEIAIWAQSMVSSNMWDNQRKNNCKLLKNLSLGESLMVIKSDLPSSINHQLLNLSLDFSLFTIHILHAIITIIIILTLEMFVANQHLLS